MSEGEEEDEEYKLLWVEHERKRKRKRKRNERKYHDSQKKISSKKKNEMKMIHLYTSTNIWTESLLFFAYISIS